MALSSKSTLDSALLLATYILFPLAIFYIILRYERNEFRKSNPPVKWGTLPVTTGRERTLSICSTAGPEQPPATGHVESLFFKLPPELRYKVYEAYMGCYEEVCVFRDGRRLRAFGRRGEGHRAVGHWPVDMLPLLQTCRQIYTEAVPLLYSMKTFHFAWANDFLAFAASVLPHRFALLKKVGMTTGRCLVCLWPPEPLSYRACHCDWGVSDRWERDRRAGYPLLAVDFGTLDCGIRSQLPALESQKSHAAWDISCRLMSTLPRLEHVTIVITDAPPLEGTPEDYEDFFKSLNLLRREHLDVRIHLEGTYIGMKYEWRRKLGEVEWKQEDPDAKLSYKRKSDARRTWLEEWSNIQADVRHFYDLDLLVDYMD